MQYCSLQHQILFSSPDTSTTEHHFPFGPAPSFFLGLLVVLRSSPVVYWTLSNLGDSSFVVIHFCLLIQFMSFSRQGHWGGLLFPPPVDHFLLELSTVTHPLWVALHSMAHGFTSSPSATASAMAHLKEALMPEPPWQLYRKL